MTKPFFEVFVTLKLNQELTDLFSGAMVERVVSTSHKDFLKIYLTSDHLISKQNIHAVEREIKNQLFQQDHRAFQPVQHVYGGEPDGDIWGQYPYGTKGL